MNFIIVDDEEVIRHSVSRFLEQRGHNCKTASSGKEALEMINNDSLDALITDYKMPGMNGFELLKEIKRKFPNIKVIIFSAYSNDWNIFTASRYGAYRFCSKSNDLDNFSQIIQEIELLPLSGIPLN